METSTVLFIAVLAVGFIFLRWLITPIPHDVPPEVEELRNQSNRANGASSSASSSATGARANSGANSGATGTSTGTRRTNRDITESMVEVVQAIAPQLTPGQIRHDLRRTGSVEVTINRYMETGSLPFPPGEAPAQAPRQTGPGQATDPHNIPPSTVSLNLLEKYGLDEGAGDESGASATGPSASSSGANASASSSGANASATSGATGSWGSSKAERSSLLHKKRQEMILNARKRLANQLQNDISGDLSGKM